MIYGVPNARRTGTEHRRTMHDFTNWFNQPKKTPCSAEINGKFQLTNQPTNFDRSNFINYSKRLQKTITPLRRFICSIFASVMCSTALTTSSVAYLVTYFFSWIGAIFAESSSSLHRKRGGRRASTMRDRSTRRRWGPIERAAFASCELSSACRSASVSRLKGALRAAQSATRDRPSVALFPVPVGRNECDVEFMSSRY